MNHTHLTNIGRAMREYPHHVSIGRAVATNQSVLFNFGTVTRNRYDKECDVEESNVENTIKCLRQSAQQMVDEANLLLEEANALASEVDQWTVTMQKLSK